MQNVYLDNAATTPLTPEVKQYVIELLDDYYNPSSLYQGGKNSRKIIEQSRANIAKFINGKSDNIIFTSGGSASNTLAIKGLTSENPIKNKYTVFYSPTSHKSMINASKSCLSIPLKVNNFGMIDVNYLEELLIKHDLSIPLVCVEAANSEIGTINPIMTISDLVHRHGGIIIVDATGYIPSKKIDMELWHDVDMLTFSGHKLHALKGVGVLYNNSNIDIKPLIFGSQENGIFGGTENIIGIASLGKSIETYDYSSVSFKSRDYVYNNLINNIKDCYMVGALFEYRLPNNLYMCFKGVQGDLLMSLLDINGIQVSTGSACNSGDLSPSATLTAIGMNKEDIHSCIRMSFSGNETKEELDYVCIKLKECVERLRDFSK